MPRPCRHSLHAVQPRRALQSRAKIESLEDIVQVSGDEGLGGYLEVTAELHRAVSLLWEGVGNVLIKAALSETGATSTHSTDLPLLQVRNSQTKNTCREKKVLENNHAMFQGDGRFVNPLGACCEATGVKTPP